MSRGGGGLNIFFGAMISTKIITRTTVNYCLEMNFTIARADTHTHTSVTLKVEN